MDLKAPLVFELGAVKGRVVRTTGQVTAIIRDFGYKSQNRFGNAVIVYLKYIQKIIKLNVALIDYNIPIGDTALSRRKKIVGNKRENPHQLV